MARNSQELIPWMFLLNDQLVVNKDASLMACYQVTGLPKSSVSIDIVNQTVQKLADTLNQISEIPLTFFWSMRSQKIAVPCLHQNTSFVQQILKKSSAEYYTQHPQYEKTYYLSIIGHPQVGLHKLTERFRFLLHHENLPLLPALYKTIRTAFDTSALFAYTTTELEQVATLFEEQLQSFCQAQSALSFRRLQNSCGDLGKFLYSCLRIKPYPQKCILPFDGYLIDQYLSAHTLRVHNDYLSITTDRQDPLYVNAMTVRVAHQGEGRRETQTDLFSHLYDMPGEMVISHCFRILPQHESKKFIHAMRRYFDQQRYSLRSYLAAALNGGDFSHAVCNPGRDGQMQECEQALGQLTLRTTCFGRHNVTLLVFSHQLDALQKTVENIQSTIHSCNSLLIHEKEHALSSYCVTIPGMQAECVRWSVLSNHNIAELLPVSGMDGGDACATYLSEQMGHPQTALSILTTTAHTPYYWQAHVRDNGHGLIVGPVGSGKSILGNYLWTQFYQYPNARIIIFDKDFSARIPILLQDGCYLEHQTNDQTLRFNPVQKLDNPEYREWLVDWIQLLLSPHAALPKEDIADIHHAVLSTSHLPKHLWRLESIALQLRHSDVRDQFSPWVGAGCFASYFDNVQDHFSSLLLEKTLLGIDTQHILHHTQLCAPFLSYAFQAIHGMLTQQQATGHKGPTLLYLSEAWHLFQITAFEKILEHWIKTLRKKMACVWFDTQSLEDISSSALFASIRDNVATRIYLPNPQALSNTLYRILEQEFRLSSESIHKIAHAVTKRDYFIEQNARMQQIQLPLTPQAVNLFRSDTKAQTVFHRCSQNRDPTCQWKEDYLHDLKPYL